MQRTCPRLGKIDCSCRPQNPVLSAKHKHPASKTQTWKPTKITKHIYVNCCCYQCLFLCFCCFPIVFLSMCFHCFGEFNVVYSKRILFCIVYLKLWIFRGRLQGNTLEILDLFFRVKAENYFKAFENIRKRNKKWSKYRKTQGPLLMFYACLFVLLIVFGCSNNYVLNCLQNMCSY